VQLERLTEWLWCLRTPIVQAYAIREGDGFNLVDTTTSGQEDAILTTLAEIDGEPAGGLRARTGARLVAPRDEAGVIARVFDARRSDARGVLPAICRRNSRR
jgi:hypothetical protein